VDPGATLGPDGGPLPPGALQIMDVALSNQGIFYYTATWPMTDSLTGPQRGRAIGGLLRDGQSRFQQTLTPVSGPNGSFGYPLLVDENENLYTGLTTATGTEVVSFDQLGNLRWTLATSAPVTSLESFSEDNGLFVEPSPLMAFDSSGKLLWSHGVMSDPSGHSPTVDVDGTTSVLQSIGGSSELAAFGEDGTPRWTFDLPNGERPRSSHVLDSASRIYFVGDQGTLFAVDGHTGQRVWSVSLDPGLTIQQGVLGLTPAGSLIASAVEQLTGVYAGAPMAASPWPRFRGDNRNRSCPTPADTPGLPH
jgi:outer membrane protein assembly factor BamB